MGTYERMNAQHFVKRHVENIFEQKKMPELRYVSHITRNASRHPRLMHSHKEHTEIILICDGSSEFLIHNKKYPVKRGDLLIYNPGIIHDDVTGKDSELELYCAAIGNLDMKKTGNNTPIPENGLIPEKAPFIYHTEEREYDFFYNIFRLMFDMLRREETGAESVSAYLIEAMIVRVMSMIDRIEGVAVEPMENPSVIGMQIKEYIDEHYMEPLTLQSIGKELHISPYYLSHIFKDMSGYSPIQYLLRRRLGEAQNLLISTDLSITDIAGMVGFDTQSYFNAQFTKNVGIPPKKYRQNYLTKKEEES